MTGPIIVKFGGSLLGSPDLAAMLGVAGRFGAIVAPGGGPFADLVRVLQPQQGFSDRAAHAMAISAMDQVACLLHDLEPSLPLCSTPADFAAARLCGLGAIWRPSAMALGADLPASWDVTSDSLAIWLAIALRASRVIILKSAGIGGDETIDALASSGTLDAHAPGLARRFAGTVEALGPASPRALEMALARSDRRAA